MANSEYWDEGEFNFFSSLDDVDKLMYLYDLMVGYFVHEYNGETNVFDDSFEIEFEEEEESIRHQVIVSFDKDSVDLRGTDIELLDKVLGDMVMNGLLVSNKRVLFDGDDVLVRCKFVGETNPISLNWHFVHFMEWYIDWTIPTVNLKLKTELLCLH